MKIDLNDPKLTAYALGELHGEEALRMENEIEKDPAAKKLVEEIQATATLVQDALGEENSTARLTPQQKVELMNRAQMRRWKLNKWILGFSGLATAGFAAVILALNLRENLESHNLRVGAARQFEMKPAQEPIQQPRQRLNQADEMNTTENEAYVFAESDTLSMHDELDGGYQPSPASSAAAPQLYGSLNQSRGSVGHFSILPANTETYTFYEENQVLNAKENPLSTFSADVDTASYANVRRFLVNSSLPPKDAIRIEEMVNYFSYDYASPTDQRPFAAHIEMAKNPWNAESRLVRIGIKGQEIAANKRPAANLVFLIDVSGSMSDENKLPLVQRALNLLVDQMREQDRIAIAVYAGNSGLLLDSTSGDQKSKIKEAIESLSSGGSTNGAAGIEEAYKAAQKSFIKGGINRVILATDGDFNVGTTSEGDLIRLIEQKAKTGVFLSVLGFGMGNYKDSTMQKLANRGNGNYAYIDTLREAKKTLVEQAGGTLQTIAKDVKFQVEFNPAQVSSYRLIGYEKRVLNKEDFNDDKKDAGEIGAGHTVTAFYEVFPANRTATSKVDPLKYQSEPQMKESSQKSDELLTLKIRYKKPQEDKSQLIEIPVVGQERAFENASSDFKFAVSVIGFAQILKESSHQGKATLDQVIELADENKKRNGVVDEYRQEFVELVKKARSLKSSQPD